MRLAFFIVCLFFLTVAIQAYARDLSLKERAALMHFDKNEKVMDELISQIDSPELSIPDYLSYQVNKNSCLPVKKLREHVLGADEDYKDQTLNLSRLNSVCTQGIVGLTSLYFKYK